jgi:hypothetical protein
LRNGTSFILKMKTSGESGARVGNKTPVTY